MPVKVLELALEEPLPALAPPPDGQGRALILVRLHDAALGTVQTDIPGDGLSPARLARLVWDELAERIAAHRAEDGLAPVSELSARGLPNGPHEVPRCQQLRRWFLEQAPAMTVLIPSRERPDRLRRCVESILACAYPQDRVEVIVVDNAPRTDATWQLVEELHSMTGGRVRYAREDIPGSASARNRGLRLVSTETVAMTDDDVIVDRHWLTEIARAFEAYPEAGAVSGLLMPAELETQAQVWFEQYGGFGRGFDRRVFDLKANRPPEEPLYPWNAGLFGTGNNFSFRTRALLQIGGFDPALGNGTPALGGVDSEVLLRTILSGYQIVYEPNAIAHHVHRQDYEGLRRQVYAYGAGLVAYYLKTVLAEPRFAFDFARKLPAGIRWMRSPESHVNRYKQDDYPAELRRQERRGMLYGPLAYVRSRRRYGSHAVYRRRGHHPLPRPGRQPPRQSSSDLPPSPPSPRPPPPDPPAEDPPTAGTPRSPAVTGGPRLRSLAALLITLAVGLLLVAVAYRGARLGNGWASPLFWTGLLVLFLPVAFRLTGQAAGRGERLWLVILLGLALYCIKVLLEPGAFTLHDELGQYRSVADILRTGRLYITNPEVPAYSFYPGLLTVTSALSALSGLGIFTSGVIVLALARVILVGGLFLLIERLSDSSRIAGLAVVVYAANPNFVFFDSQFSYESMALGLGVMTLWAAGRVFDRQSGRVRAFVVVALIDSALILSHHLTSYAVALALLLWALGEAVRHRSLRDGGLFILLAGLVVGATAGYAAWSWPATESDIGSSVTGSVNGLINVLTGQVAGRHPFTAAPGYSNPVLEQVVGLASVGLLLLALPWGFYAIWRHRPRNTGLFIVSACALLYPVSLALRLNSAGSETSNRTSEFIFVALGTLLAIAFVSQRKSPAVSRRTALLPVRLLAVLYLGVVFVGGITIGNPPYQILPGNFEVSAANRSVDPEGVDAALWAKRLPPGRNFVADENDEELFTAYTRLLPQRGQLGNTALGHLFTSPDIGPIDHLLIKYFKLSFAVVDRRDSAALPADGHYFSTSTPNTSGHPIPLASLTKFSRNPCVSKVFASGHVAIYDLAAILAGCR